MTRNKVTLAGIAGALAIMAGSVATLPATAAEGASASAIEKGKSVAFSRKKGNCLACHMMGDGAAAGNIGPPLIAMKSRYPEKAKLRAQIWDATAANPDSAMPPFGKHGIVTEEELDNIVEYVWSL
jgi:sulfur-oxidizing protein SoxX